MERWNYHAGAVQDRLRLNSVRVLADGGAELYYDDGGTFRGNTLIAHVRPHGEVEYVEMSG